MGDKWFKVGITVKEYGERRCRRPISSVKFCETEVIYDEKNKWNLKNVIPDGNEYIVKMNRGQVLERKF